MISKDFLLFDQGVILWPLAHLQKEVKGRQAPFAVSPWLSQSIPRTQESTLAIIEESESKSRIPLPPAMLSKGAKWLQERNAWLHFLSVPLCPKVRESCFLSYLVPSSASISTEASSKPSFEMPTMHTPSSHSPRQPSTLSLVRMTVKLDPINLG